MLFCEKLNKHLKKKKKKVDLDPIAKIELYSFNGECLFKKVFFFFFSIFIIRILGDPAIKRYLPAQVIPTVSCIVTLTFPPVGKQVPALTHIV